MKPARLEPFVLHRFKIGDSVVAKDIESLRRISIFPAKEDPDRFTVVAPPDEDGVLTLKSNLGDHWLGLKTDVEPYRKVPWYER